MSVHRRARLLYHANHSVGRLGESTAEQQNLMKATWIAAALDYHRLMRLKKRMRSHQAQLHLRVNQHRGHRPVAVPDRAECRECNNKTLRGTTN